MLINLMDYIAKDYRMAVSDGEVINDFEFAEMQEFSGNALMYFLALEEAGILTDVSAEHDALTALNALIASKASPAEVSAQAAFIRAAIVERKLVPLAPLKWPNHANGKALFNDLCATCHGAEGKGDGPAGTGLTPSPTKLSDRSIMDGVSPLQAFNTITLGIEGTSMRSFKELSEEEIWDVAFYIMELPYTQEKAAESNPIITLTEVATMNNEALREAYPGLDIPSIRKRENLIISGPMEIARMLLNQAESASVAGAKDEAVVFALKAYLQGVEPSEPKIKASDNALFERLESSMMGLRESIKSGNAQEIQTNFEVAYSTIDEAEALLGSTERSMWMTAVITLSILIREGLEAFFVILAILGILQSMGAKTALRWVHGGWIAAVFFGVVGWFFAGSLMQWDAQSRELMEGLIALFAVVVLLYLGFWMHGKTNADKWKVFVETKVKGLISKNNMIGLASFSFIVVFREAFESVLFLSSLTVDGRESSNIGVLVGTLSSAVLLFFIAWAMLRWFKRLPISKVFLYSSIVVLALAFILAGGGVHAIQEGGYLDIHSFPINIRLSLIGLYPTYETIATQVLVFGLILALWKYSAAKVVKAQ
ncbi:MAG: FTR1 family protein [Flavobacteriales bacterium]|nr:FTR1 family protein [Flavobacteriales bacterium]